MALRSSSRRAVADVSVFLDEAQLARVRSIWARVWKTPNRPTVSQMMGLCTAILMRGCAALEGLPIDGEPSFLSEDDVLRALREQAERNQTRDQERAAALEVSQ